MADDESAIGGGLSVSRGYREQVSGGRGKRRARTSVLYTDEEWAVITVVAAREGMKSGAWVAQVAHDAALRAQGDTRPEREVVASLIAELQEHRRVLTIIGGNLNDVARAASSTGDIENAAAAAAVLRLVRSVVRTSDVTVAQVRAELLR